MVKTTSKKKPARAETRPLPKGSAPKALALLKADLKPDLSKKDTKQHILDVAEKLFAEHGLDAISLRQIIKQAGVNIAAIHYHFGSKDDLLLQLVARHLPQISARRLELLNQCAEAPDRPPLLEQIVEAFVRPGMESMSERQTPYGRQLLAKISFQTGQLQNRLYLDAYYKTDVKFIEALHQALPDLPKETLYWRFSFILGMLIYTVAGIGRIEFLSEGSYRPLDIERSIKEAVTYTCAGLRANS